jgi:hypothetical protein
MVSLFERLDKGRPPTEEVVKQSRRGGDRKAFLLDILVNGPAPTTLVHQRGAAHGFTRKQLWSAREQMKIVAFKEVGKPRGRWFLALPQHAGYPSTAGNTPDQSDNPAV